MTLAALGIAVFLLNIPFGWWRGGARKFSVSWFVAIHAAVPLVYLLRMRLGVGWGVETFPVLVGAYFGGQWVGSSLRRHRPA